MGWVNELSFINALRLLVIKFNKLPLVNIFMKSKQFNHKSIGFSFINKLF